MTQLNMNKIPYCWNNVTYPKNSPGSGLIISFSDSSVLFLPVKGIFFFLILKNKEKVSSVISLLYVHMWCVLLCAGVMVCVWERVGGREKEHACVHLAYWLTNKTSYSTQLLYSWRSSRNWGHNLYWKLYLLFFKWPQSNRAPAPILFSKADILLY